MPDSFPALLPLWFAHNHQSRLRHLQLVRRSFTKWINPRLGTLPLNGLRGFHIAACLEQIKAGGAPTVANDARRHIRKVLNYGVSLGLLDSNAASSLSLPRVDVTERARERALTLEEMHALLRAMAHHRDWFGRDSVPV